ncbi:alpha-L-rhamnosidase-related protein [Arachidicoccus rhizosphaerae]|nr:alpha-L-rhamnosidase C-terminal domain-containing protein [Arachidicoccus rhizosphaerae]
MLFIGCACCKWPLAAQGMQGPGRQDLKVPTGLRVDLLDHPERVYKMGILTNQSLLSVTAGNKDSLQFEAITSRRPAFCWIVPGKVKKQAAYEIILTKAMDNNKTAGPVWSSGKIENSASVQVPYTGPALLPATVYQWKVRIWDRDAAGKSDSRFSGWQLFRTADSLTDSGLPTFVVQKEHQSPIDSLRLDKDYLLYDFGKDGFAQPVLRLQASKDDSIFIVLGEKLIQGKGSPIDQQPPGTVRYRIIRIAVKQGIHTYQVPITPDQRNTKPSAVKMPSYIGEVLPFRYLALHGNLTSIRPLKVSRNFVHIPFKDNATVFHSSDSTLNQIWELCKYTIKATSFTGYYLDGDRERIPYEADALINQLSHYSTDADFNMTKRTLSYLIYHPTWPTEWSLQNLLIAYYDYMYSGDHRSVARIFKQLQPKLLTALQDSTGLISTRTGKQSVDFLKSIHYKVFDGNEGLKDIVDWPHTPEETDSFVFTDYNAVVNAFYYKALQSMATLATATHKPVEALAYTRQAAALKAAFLRHFSDPATGLIKDGTGTQHSSLHANMFALAFGLVPDEHVPAVIHFIKSRGLSCSVYGAQFLLEALGRFDQSDDAIQLITSKDKRSWFNMLREGSTMTMEAWGQDFKPNQDWNHAWGTAPANYIVRFLMGIRPLKPGFEQVIIEPHPFGVQQASIRYQTIRGDIDVSFQIAPDHTNWQLTLPGNTTATVRLPFAGKSNPLLFMDGQKVQGKLMRGYYQIENVPSGTHRFTFR